MIDRDRVWSFVALTGALSVPFWALGTLVEAELLPGLPVSALMIVAPAISALVLTARERGWSEGPTFLKRAMSLRGTSWPSFAIAIAIMPAATMAAWTWMRASGVEMPEPSLTLSGCATLFAAFLPAAFAEELGWSGYMADPARRQWGFLGASALIGLIWAAWHVPPLLQAGRALDWIAWWTLATVSARIVSMAVFQWSNRSVAAVSILHAAQNTAWQAFPVDGSHYDPKFTGPVFALCAAAAAGRVLVSPQRQ